MGTWFALIIFPCVSIILCIGACLDQVASIPQNLRAFENQRFAGDC